MGVFAAEDDGFDDALASLDVEELVAASQRTASKKHSPPPERSGGTLCTCTQDATTRNAGGLMDH